MLLVVEYYKYPVRQHKIMIYTNTMNYIIDAMAIISFILLLSALPVMAWR